MGHVGYASTSRDHVEPPASHVGGMNRRGGRIDIEDKPGKNIVEEALEETFPASDPPAFTPDGYSDRPPPNTR